ncbi:GntR family transcriptional regulator/MocR family aminotransferase [Actinoplanes octamycinicus]|uniref:GntR family transcriptional regulator/MocR family aminotransferase n=1 Tax=Actinoplanes octamycinicus TaxID=135948 RepID=A0A7W7GZY0_9ACTN|nr:PLP-dependent aminotransferase family protein [Actinoplanes octamycinicus]MBB4741373.1 GntR family transcriptional regulator/MocR family aminotransferase [Actinoplanes octamycinicus]GIE62829.1 GntR family transcriptional regulator [Actinoplanes octamycinicus]
MAEEWARNGLDLHLGIDRVRGLRAGLEDALRTAVRDGRLAAGDRLPSSRALAQELGVARGTVTQVYEQLTAEGYLTSRARSGVRIAPRPRPESTVSVPAVSPCPPLPGGFDLRPGFPDLSMFPRREWLAATRHVLRTMPSTAFGYGDPAGDPALRSALAGYLGRSRGVLTGPDQIIVCAGYTHALRIICQALGGTIGFEDPTRPDYPAMAERLGLGVTRLPVDADGLVVNALAGEAAVVVTPAHQFPLGVTLSPQRRRDLLDWARRTDAVIVEDDYDGEFRYDRQPVGALQGLAPERVIYAGTVSKTVAPGLRIAWLAVPVGLVPALRAVLRFDEAYVNVIDQLVLAHLIGRGDLDRHLRRCRVRYRQRRDLLGRAVAARLPAARLSGISAGLHATLSLPGCSEPELLGRLAARGVVTEGIGSFYRDARDAPPGVVIGYATPPQHAYARAIDALLAVCAGDDGVAGAVPG